MILTVLKIGKWDTFVTFMLPIGQNNQSLFRIIMNELYLASERKTSMRSVDDRDSYVS